jgi:hypothetical protein
MRWLVLLVAACSPYDPNLPAQPFLCGPSEPKCPDGYTCQTVGTQLVCTTTAPGNPDGGNTGDGGACAFTGDLAVWDFTAAPGSQQQTGPLSMAPGVVAGPVKRSATLLASDGTDSINSSGWPTGALDTNTYYTFSVTPPTGCGMDISSLTLDVAASGTGPTMAALGSSADNFAATISIAANSTSMPALAIQGQTGAVELRVYGFSAQAATGTMRIQNKLTVTGALH